MTLLTSKEFAPITKHEEHYCRYLCAVVVRFATSQANKMSYMDIAAVLFKEGNVKLDPVRIKVILDRERGAGRLKNTIEVGNFLWRENDLDMLDLYRQALKVRCRRMTKIAKAIDTEIKYDASKQRNSYTERKDIWS